MASYDINYNDERFTKVESEKNAAIKESDQMYNQMINDSSQYFDKQIEAAEQWGETQKQNQQAQTDFAIEQIEQQKDQAHKDYLKEQSGAYVDWQKQSNDYGSNAEQMADSGLAHTGYSESSKVSTYNTYQNRVATAREVYNRAVLNYDNAIKDARLQNNSVLAEIAYNTLQKSLELGLQGFQYKNQLVLEKANVKREIDNTYYGRYQNVLAQINTENAMAEQIRQYNESLAEQKRQYNESMAENKRQFNETIALQKKNSVRYSSSGGGGSRSYSGSGDNVADGQLKGSGGGATAKAAAATNAGAKATKKASALKQVNSSKKLNAVSATGILASAGVWDKAKKSTPMLTPTQWLKGKKTGELASEFAGIDTYGEYLKVYCNWAIDRFM